MPKTGNHGKRTEYVSETFFQLKNWFSNAFFLKKNEIYLTCLFVCLSPNVFHHYYWCRERGVWVCAPMDWCPFVCFIFSHYHCCAWAHRHHFCPIKIYVSVVSDCSDVCNCIQMLYNQTILLSAKMNNDGCCWCCWPAMAMNFQEPKRFCLFENDPCDKLPVCNIIALMIMLYSV